MSQIEIAGITAAAAPTGPPAGSLETGTGQPTSLTDPPHRPPAIQPDQEKLIVQKLLRGLCDGIVSPAHPRPGRKPMPLGDAVCAMVVKVYTTLSGRRAMTEIQASMDAGLLPVAPSFNSVFTYFDNPQMTALLGTLIEDSATPLSCIEARAVAESSDFRKVYHSLRGHDSLRVHAMVGTLTRVVTAASVADGDAGKSPEAIPRADGSLPYISFRSNSKGHGPAMWRRLCRVFLFCSDEFVRHYQGRMNPEGAFAFIKRRFGAAVCSRNFVAQVNEVLCKLLCHNLACLAQAMYELGIAPSEVGIQVPGPLAGPPFPVDLDIAARDREIAALRARVRTLESQIERVRKAVDDDHSP